MAKSGQWIMQVLHFVHLSARLSTVTGKWTPLAFSSPDISSTLTGQKATHMPQPLHPSALIRIKRTTPPH
jgi:hypothetical protein